MPKANLSGMTVEALMDLRKRVDETLLKRRAELQQQLERIAVVSGARVVRGGGSALRGRKVPPTPLSADKSPLLLLHTQGPQ